MRNKLPFFMIAVLLTGCFGGYAPRDKVCPEIEAIPGEPTILAIGDSVFAWRNQTCETIPDVLALELEREVQHHAVNGARVTGGEYPIVGQYESGDWQWVIVDGGGNDLNTECECGVDCDATLDELVSANGTSGQLPELVDEILADGANVLVYGYFQVREDAYYGFGECIEEIDELRRRQSLISQTRPDVLFVDGRDRVTVATAPDAYAFDNVHPSDEGARIIGELLAERILAFEAERAAEAEQ